jgi:hypothetical protein
MNERCQATDAAEGGLVAIPDAQPTGTECAPGARREGRGTYVASARLSVYLDRCVLATWTLTKRTNPLPPPSVALRGRPPRTGRHSELRHAGP